MGVLAEYLKSEVGHLRTERQTRRESVAEWNHSLDGLYAKLAEWIAAADGDLGLIGSRLEQHRTEEPRLGPYLCSKLAVLWGDELSGGAYTVADVVPRARFVAADLRPVDRDPRPADGMVEVRESRFATHYLFRWKNPDGDEWFICTVSAWANVHGGEHGRVKPLTAEEFEAAVLSAVR